MPGPTTAPTDREKAAIFALAAGFLPDWTTAFIAADEKPSKTVASYSALHSNVSHWKNSAKVQRLLQDAQRWLGVRDQEQRDQATQEERRKMEEGSHAGKSDCTEPRNTARNVDYYDPAEQRKQINRIIQEASDDPKTQLDAIKAIQQTQRDDRQAARDQKQVQSYLPLRCNSCPLMEKARKKLPK